jgi:hypothetical protein
MIYVFTGTHSEFEQFCDRHGLNRYSDAVTWVSSIRDLYGTTQGLVLCGGNFHLHPDLSDVRGFCYQQQMPCVVVPEV